MVDQQNESIQQRALRLLKAIKARTENSGQPVFLAELVHDLKMDEAGAQAAFRYLADKRWIQTFDIPYTGRINTAGYDVMEAADRRSPAAEASAPSPPADHETLRDRDPAMEWDVFISHASEDKEEFVRPLAERLRQHGLRVWYDEFTLKVGDSLRRSIDRGLVLTQPSVAIDGSKFKAVNNRDKNFTRAKVERRMAQIEESVARYLEQLDTADRQEPSEALTTKTNRLKEKIETLKEQMRRLERLKVEMLATPDQQISLTDPDARSMATSGRGSGVVGYNVQIAVEATHHLIVMHEVTNDGTDRSQLSHVANETKRTLGVEKLDAVADRGYFNSEEILACEEAGITVTLPKPMTSNAKAEGRFGKQDFRYVTDEDVYVCPAGEKLAYSFTTQDKGMVLRRYRTTACRRCAIKESCTKGKERLISRWENEHILEAVQRRLDEHPEKMRQRRETVEHPFGTIKARMGATHFLTKTLPRVASEMALHVLAYNLTRVMNIIGIQPLITAMRA